MLSSSDCDEWCISRHPRIGRGKHNIHLEAYSSPIHEALACMAKEAGIDDLLSAYQGKTSHLRETGLSITCPSTSAQHGEGMELHSDGPEGENTVLMAFDDIDYSMGSLLTVPGSHDRYVEGKGHGSIDPTTVCTPLCYQARCPVCIDGKSLQYQYLRNRMYNNHI